MNQMGDRGGTLQASLDGENIPCHNYYAGVVDLSNVVISINMINAKSMYVDLMKI